MGDLWLNRLENAPHYLERWLEHQHEDKYWLNNTVGTDYDAIKIPVYAVSGHADCWPNTVSRLLQNLSIPARGLQGAWCHRYPHLGIPGPTADFLSDATRWFDQWLKQRDTGIMDEATYQVYLQDSVRPQSYYETRPGRWVGEAQWPSPQVIEKSYLLSKQGLSLEEADDTQFEICSPQTVGMASGEYMPWFAFGPAEELPADQQNEDAGSLVFDIEVEDASLEILGNAIVQLTVSCDQPQALLAVRLCDVWPDGASTMITRGILNLSQRNSKSNPEALEPGKQYAVEISLNHVGYVIPVGHKLRLSISTSYWPMAWPSPNNANVKVFSASSQFKLPLRSVDAVDGKLTEYTETKTGEPVATTTLRGVKQNRLLITDPETGQSTLEIYADNGKTRFEHSQMEMGSVTTQRYSINNSDPLTARAEYKWDWEYSRGDWSVTTKTRTVVSCDAVYFYLEAESTAFEGDNQMFKKSWNQKYPRDHF